MNNIIILGTVMCLHRVTRNDEAETKAVQLIIDNDDADISVIVSLEAARQFSIGTKVALTLESREDATH